MNRIYKDLRIVLWVTVVVCDLLMLYSAYASITLLGLFQNLLLIWFVFLLILCIVRIKTATRLNKLLELFNNCRLNEYIAELEKLMAQKLSKNAKAFLSLNYAAAKCEKGEYQTALDILNDVKLSDRKQLAQWRFVRYHNMAVCESYIGNYADADRYAAFAKSELENIKKGKENAKDNYMMLTCILNVNKGIYDGAEDFLKGKKWRSKAQEMHCMYLLARIYQHDGNYEKAKEYYGFCADMGGDSKIAEYSRNQLSMM